MVIPETLINEIAEKRCVLFAGAGLSVSAGYPLWTSLIDRMIAYCNKNYIDINEYKDDLEALQRSGELISIAEYLRYKMGEYEFSNFMKSVFMKSLDKIPKIHQEISKIPFSQIITTNYDKLFELQLPSVESKGINDLKDANEKIRRNQFFIFKIHGTIDNIDSIVLGKSDYSNLIYSQPLYLETLNLIFRTKTVLFLGYSLQDPYLLNLLEIIKIRLSSNPLNYMLVDKEKYIKLKADQYEKFYNVKVIPYDPKDNHILLTKYISELSKKVQYKKKILQDKELNLLNKNTNESKKPESPFKYLNSYTQDDKNIFFGRSIDQEIFIKLISTGRIILLFGKSGVGKTSFLTAGIIPNLCKNSYLTIYTRITDSPIEKIKKALFEKYKDITTKCHLSYENDLLSILNQLHNDYNKDIVLIIDQFEEIFITLNEHDRLDIIKFLKTINESFVLKVKVIISFREDFFVEFHEIAKSIPTFFNFRFRLEELKYKDASEIIEKPFALFGISLEKNLGEKILNDLYKTNSKGDKVIEPPQLQIVCFTLFNKLKTDEKIIKEINYENLGCAKGILTDYLDYALEEFQPNQRIYSKLLLQHMVSYRNTKVPLKMSEIKNIKFTSNDSSHLNIKQILVDLEQKRIIQRSITKDNEQYELTHEYLIIKIKEWINSEIYKVKEAQDILRQEENNWKSHKNLMEPYKFKLIDKVKDKLVLDSFKRGFLLYTSIILDINLEYWIEQNIQNTQAKEFINLLLIGKNEEVKRNAIFSYLCLYNTPKDIKFVLKPLEKIGNPNLAKRIKTFTSTTLKIDEQVFIDVFKSINYRLTKNMVLIEKGEFIMGRDLTEVQQIIESGAHHSMFEGEHPRRIVAIADYLIDKYLVTNLEYSEFDKNHTFPKGDETKPATNVSYINALKYAKWMHKELPTEEMWEKAARGKDGRLFPWGNEWDSSKCNTRLSGISGTTDIKKYPEGQSPYGCFDMAGNVWEWTSTWHKANKSVIVKGGSWSKMGILPWTPYRFNYEINEGQQNVGFRCVKILE